MDGLALALRVTLSLAVVLVLLWAASRFAIKRMPGATTGESGVTIVGRRGMTRGAAVVVVRYKERDLLLGVTDANVTVIRDDPAPPEPVTVTTPVHQMGAHSSLLDRLRERTVRRR